MKVNEAIIAISQDTSKWARPRHWIGMGVAIHLFNGHRLAVVPSSHGGERWNVSALDLMDDWEVIDPHDVLNENKVCYK
jgi:hypothetical protein